MTDDDKEYLKETDKGSYYNQEAWIEELEYNKGFCHDNEYSSDESEDKDSRESKWNTSYEGVNLRDNICHRFSWNS